MKIQAFLPLIFLSLTLFGIHAAKSFAGDFEKGLFAAEMGDYATAISEWRPLAEQGDSISQYNLGLIYEYEEPFLNFKEAFYWYKKSAQQGFPEAQYRLGVAYAVGQGVDDNPLAGLMWITISFIGGNEKAAPLKDTLTGFMNDMHPEHDSEKIAHKLALECIRNAFKGCFPDHPDSRESKQEKKVASIGTR